MQSRTAEWQAQIDMNTQMFKDQFDELSVEELNRKPNEATWSIAENLQHLISVNESYFPIVASLKEGKYKVPFVGKIGFYVDLMGKIMLKGVEPTRQKKIKTFLVWEPKSGTADPDILQTFTRHHTELKKLIAEAAPLVAAHSVISSPINKNIVYTLDKAFDIIIAHEQRHFNQAKEAMEFIYEKQYNFDV